DGAALTVNGVAFIDSSDEIPTPAPAIVVKNAGSLTLISSTVTEQDAQTSPLISVDGTSSLDVSSGNNTFNMTVNGSGFIAASAGSTVLWNAANTLNITTNEDTPFSFDVRIDGTNVSSISTSSVTRGSVITNVNGSLRYTPAANFYGAGSFTFTLASGKAGTVNLIVRPVNDRPAFTNGPTITVDEDASGTQTFNNHLTSIVLGPANETNNVLHGTFGNPHNNQIATFSVSNNNSALFTAEPAINSAGRLTFELNHTVTNALAAGETASAVVQVTLNDGGGTSNGGVGTSITQSFTIAITGQNDAPVVQDVTGSASEEGPSVDRGRRLH
ncbi:MAG: Ig-like domain-containing protein, partial [Planctomyces sp.]